MHRSTSWKPGLAILATLLFSARARADEEVLVVGSRSQASGFVSRAKIEDAPREVTDAASLVEPLPGVHVRRLGADDSFATLSIRGSSSTQVALFLAGVPLSGGADPTLDLATLPLWPGASARVYRSFAPAALGRGSLGGTLVLDPPSPRAASGTEVWAAAGAFGSRRLRIGDVRGDEDGIRVATGISASRSDDDFEYLAGSAAGQDVFTRRVNAGHAAASGLAAVAIPLHFARSTGALTITTLAQARRQELPGTIRFQTPHQRLDSSRLVAALELTVPAGVVTLGVRGWGRREGLSVHDAPVPLRVPYYPGPSSTDDAIVAAGGSVGFRGRPTSSTSLEVRADGSGERFAPGSWLGAVPPPAARRASAGLALDASAVVAERATIALAARGDTWSDSGADGTSRTEAHPTGNAGVEVPVGPVVLLSHAGFVARPPSFVERFGDRGAFLGDPNLQTESAFTADAGTRASGRVGPMKVRGELAGFATWAEDLITFVRVSFDQSKATNIGRARLLGVEAELRASAYGFDLRASHTALATANEAACTLTTGGCDRPALPGRPTHDFVGDLMWTYGPVRLRYGIDVVAGIQVDVVGAIVVPTRALHSAGARLDVPGIPGLSLSLDVRNLLDLRVAEYAGVFGPERAPIGDLYDYPLPGRRVLLSARFAVLATNHP